MLLTTYETFFWLWSAKKIIIIIIIIIIIKKEKHRRILGYTWMTGILVFTGKMSSMLKKTFPKLDLKSSVS